MPTRKVDGNNDWLFGRGRNDYVTNNPDIQQNIKCNLQSFIGDCFFDTVAGLDWFNLLGSKNLLGLRLAITAAILNTTGVTELVALDVILDQSRNVTIQYSVNTVFTVIDGGVPLQDTVEVGV